jgi:hypothetical protein
MIIAMFEAGLEAYETAEEVMDYANLIYDTVIGGKEEPSIEDHLKKIEDELETINDSVQKLIAFEKLKFLLNQTNEQEAFISSEFAALQKYGSSKIYSKPIYKNDIDKWAEAVTDINTGIERAIDAIDVKIQNGLINQYAALYESDGTKSTSVQLFANQILQYFITVQKKALYTYINASVYKYQGDKGDANVTTNTILGKIKNQIKLINDMKTPFSSSYLGDTATLDKQLHTAQYMLLNGEIGISATGDGRLVTGMQMVRIFADSWGGQSQVGILLHQSELVTGIGDTGKPTDNVPGTFIKTAKTLRSDYKRAKTDPDVGSFSDKIVTVPAGSVVVGARIAQSSNEYSTFVLELQYQKFVISKTKDGYTYQLVGNTAWTIDDNPTTIFSGWQDNGRYTQDILPDPKTPLIGARLMLHKDHLSLQAYTLDNLNLDPYKDDSWK